MAAVLRVKRRLDEDPVENLLIKCKRHKPDDSQIDENLCFRLVTTVRSKDEDISKQVQKALRQQDLKANFKSHESTRSQRSRSERKENIRANRYRVVNCHRAIDTSITDEARDPASLEPEEASERNCDNEASSSDSDRMQGAAASCMSKEANSNTSNSASRDSRVHADYDIQIVDVERDIASEPPPTEPSASGITLNGQNLVSQRVVPPGAEGDSNFVYDFYYINNGSQQYSFRDLESILSIEALYDDLVYENDLRETCTDDGGCDDDDDSNDESNWRNDYPDEDPDNPRRSSDRDSNDEEALAIFHGVDEPRPYFNFRDDNDDFLAEAMGTRLHLFGSSGEEDDEGDEDDDAGYQGRQHFEGRGSYYDWYMNRARKTVLREDGEDDGDVGDLSD